MLNYPIMKCKFTVSLILAASFLVIQPAHAYWIWTPKTKKFVNPKNEPKSTPKEQFDYAKSLYEEKDWPNATIEFKKMLKHFPRSFEASESQYYLGRINEEQGKLYEAFQEYQRLIEKYPFSERIQEVNEREYKIGEEFMSGVKRQLMGVDLPVENPSIEIFNKVIENSTYGPLAPKAQYKLGLVLKSLSRYYEAEDAFNKVISTYPDSEWVDAARFQLAACRASVSQGPAYDQGAAQEAKQKFEQFVKEHPDAVLSREAEKNIADLRSKEAEGAYNIASFYEKQNRYSAAKIYYKEVVDAYPETPWAEKAAEKLKSLEKKKR